jgi:hypothetical protein
MSTRKANRLNLYGEIIDAYFKNLRKIYVIYVDKIHSFIDKPGNEYGNLQTVND